MYARPPPHLPQTKPKSHKEPTILISLFLYSLFLLERHMGTCASSQYTRKGEKLCWQTAVNIIHLDGRVQQSKEPMKAEHALSQNPNCFLCSSESMYVGSSMPHVDPYEELQLDQIYFLMPLSKSHIPLSLQDLCALAIKANAALSHSEASKSILKFSSVSHRNCLIHPSLPRVSQGYSN